MQQIGGPVGVREGTVAVVGPGTGFGAALLPGALADPLPSEAGMRAYRARSREGLELIEHLKGVYGFDEVPVEAVVSGTGISNIFGWLRSKRFPERSAEPPPAAGVIAQASLDPSRGADWELANETVDFFMEALAEELQALALAFCATGALVIAGGVVPKLLKTHRRHVLALHSRLTAHPTLSAMLADIPLFVCDDDDIGLAGARAVGERAAGSGMDAAFLFEKVAQYGQRGRSEGLSGLERWGVLKDVLAASPAAALAGGWTPPSVDIDYTAMPDNEEPVHFVRQTLRLPREFPLSPQRLFQVAFNLGQCAADESSVVLFKGVYGNDVHPQDWFSRPDLFAKDAKVVPSVIAEPLLKVLG